MKRLENKVGKPTTPAVGKDAHKPAVRKDNFINVKKYGAGFLELIQKVFSLTGRTRAHDWGFGKMIEAVDYQNLANPQNSRGILKIDRLGNFLLGFRT